MQKRIMLAIVVMAVVFSNITVQAQSIDNADTNRISCALWILNDHPFYEGEKLPACGIWFINKSTNANNSFLALPRQAMCELALFDPAGNPVEKTAAGKEYGTWTTNQIKDWFYHPKANQRAWRFFSIWPTSTNAIGPIWSNFSIPEIFQLKHAGEYTLHVHVRLARHEKNASEKVNLMITWLPEAVAKVQIRPEDVPLENRPTIDQTNSTRQ